MNKVKFEETENRMRLSIGSFFVDLNNSEYHELVKIFGSQKTEQPRPTIEQCLATIRELNKDIPQPEELLKQKANWLYLLNRLSFWDDLPVLMDIVNYERLKGSGHNYT